MKEINQEKPHCLVCGLNPKKCNHRWTQEEIDRAEEKAKIIAENLNWGKE